MQLRFALRLTILPLVLLSLNALADGRRDRVAAIRFETGNPPPPITPPTPGAASNKGGANPGGSSSDGDFFYGDVTAHAHKRTFFRHGRDHSDLPLFWLILLAVLSLGVLWKGLSLVRLGARTN